MKTSANAVVTTHAAMNETKRRSIRSSPEGGALKMGQFARLACHKQGVAALLHTLSWALLQR